MTTHVDKLDVRNRSKRPENGSSGAASGTHQMRHKLHNHNINPSCNYYLSEEWKATSCVIVFWWPRIFWMQARQIQNLAEQVLFTRQVQANCSCTLQVYMWITEEMLLSRSLVEMKGHSRKCKSNVHAFCSKCKILQRQKSGKRKSPDYFRLRE